MKISYYITRPERLMKVLCTLSEKCYYNNGKTLIVTEDDIISNNIDQVLWTYSKKHFIPHGLSSDPYIDKHPILIAKHNNLTPLPFDFDIWMFVDIKAYILLEYLASYDKFKSLKRIIFLNTEENKLSELEVIIMKSPLQNLEIEKFKQTDDGSWQNL